MPAILELPLSAIDGFISYAIDKEAEQATWDVWLSIYPSMAKGELKHKSFVDFKQEVLVRAVEVTPKTADEIDKEMESVIARYEGR